MVKKINEKSMLPKGTLLHGNHRIDGYLSSGGFGNTYVATHIRFKEKVAIKEFFMKDVTERDADGCRVKVSNSGKEQEFNEQRAKFEKEAQRLRLLHNEHIVKVHDLFDENNTTYYVMDYVDGVSLKEKLENTHGPLDQSLVLNVLIQVLDALHEAHASNILHLDLKPANIMMDNETGEVRLIDFGASKQFDSTVGGAAATSAVTFTSGFAPTEQMEKRFDKFGPWTDFYALGATLFNLLTNRVPPMPGDIMDDTSIDKHDTLPMPGVNPKMRDLVLWLMQYDRKKRPVNVDAIIQYLYDVNINDMQPYYEGDTVADDAPEANTANDDTQLDDTSIDSPLSAPVALSEPVSSKSTKSTMTKWLIPAVVCLGLLAGFLLMMFTNGGPASNNDQQPQVQDSTLVDETQEKQAPKGTEVDVKGKEETQVEAPATEPEPKDAPTMVVRKQMTLTLGPCNYTGSVNAKGLPHGKGSAEFKDGRYTGDFVNGNAVSDYGRFEFNNGDVFEGKFNNGFIKGRYTAHDNGSYFEGSFKNNKPANGQWYDKQGKRIE